MKLLEPTQKFIDAYQDGVVSKDYKFWFNMDLSFIATSNITNEEKMKNLDKYNTLYGLDLTYEELMKNFNVPFNEFLQEFKDSEIYKKLDFKY
jgi:hypothetical protein